MAMMGRQPGTADTGSLDSIVLVMKNVSAMDVLGRVYEALKPSGTVVIYSSVQEVIIVMIVCIQLPSHNPVIILAHPPGL